MQDIKDGQLLPIHFDLPRHVIPLRTFVETAENAGRIAEVINQELFGGAFVLEIVVMPPEEGTFLSRLGITVKSVSAVALVAILSGPLGDFGSGMFQELISKSATDVGKDVVSSIRSSMEQLQSYSEDKEALCGAASTITVAAVKWFLQEDNEEIDTLPFAPALTEALIAKRKFYDACREVPDLKGIGFSRSPTFPIKRSDFQRISKLPESADGDDWIVTIENITGDSPNWRRLDKSRSWKGTDQGGHSRYFTIRDERFWEMVSRRELSTRIADSMKVQWAYVQGAKGPKKHIVLRVLEFNGMKISPPMSDREIRPILDSFKSVQDQQRSLFDEE